LAQQGSPQKNADKAKLPFFFPAFASFQILLCFEISSFGKLKFGLSRASLH